MEVILKLALMLDKNGDGLLEKQEFNAYYKEN